MTEAEMIARGRAVFESCYNGVVPTPETIDPAGFTGATMKIFNDFWGGIEHLSMREKRLVVMGVLLAKGRGDMFAIHAQSALRNGELDPDALRGAVLMGLPYVGFPAASPCMLESEKAIADFLRAEPQNEETTR